MTNLKKLTIAAAMTTCLMAATNASADPLNATLVWQGTVPETGVSDSLIITGENGDLAEVLGTIVADVDGTFKSSSLTLEAHTNDGNAESPQVGELQEVKWTLKKANITYGGVEVAGTTPEVLINNTEIKLNGTVDADVIKASINQTAPLEASDVGGKAVAASITLIADVVNS